MKRGGPSGRPSFRLNRREFAPEACGVSPWLTHYVCLKQAKSTTRKAEVGFVAKRYRSWAERRDIVRAVIADAAPPPLASFDLSPSEEIYFRARSARLVDSLARRSAFFKAYYNLRTERPFSYVAWLVIIVVLLTASAATYLYLHSSGNSQYYPILGALVGAAVAALGWGVAGWIAHRNAVRQNTNNLLFARFSQTTFTDAMHRFHSVFGNDPQDAITPERLRSVAAEGEEGKRATASVNYLLNYFEFIAAGVIRGDLDAQVVKENIRGVICYYYDKCEPHILAANRRNHRTFEYLRKLRTHYREP